VPTRLALFDLDNTLIDRAGGFRSWARAFVAARALGRDDEVSWLEAADGDGFVSRLEFLERVRSRYALAEPVEELLAAYRSDYSGRLPPLAEETGAALRLLRAAGWKLGIVTNGEPTQEQKILASGLDELVDGWVVSELVGARKPEPEIFRAAAKACGCALDGAYVVGDNPEADIGGAIACGLPSVWIARGREWGEAAYRPTFVAGSVAEAVSHIV
jgi:putative hydrolase of the HAD superfamily